MKRVLFAIVALAGVAALSGCASSKQRCNSCGGGYAQGGCDSCDAGGCSKCKKGQLFGSHVCDDSCLIGQRRNRAARQQQFINHGPPQAQVTYPYYTSRGPRDFLAPGPRDIGY